MFAYIVLSAALAGMLTAYSRRILSSSFLFRFVCISSTFVFAAVHYWFATEVRDGLHDSSRYHREATRHVEAAEFGSSHDVLGGAFGGGAVDVVLSLVYRVTGPNLLLGFSVFAALSALGRLWMIDGIRRLIPEMNEKLSLAFIFFLPSAAFFAVFTGKEPLVMLGSGAIYRMVLKPSFAVTRLVVTVPAVLVLALIRPHMLVVIAVSAIALRTAMVGSVRTNKPDSMFRKFLMASAGMAAMAAAWFINSTRLGDGAGLTAAVANVRDFTDRTTAGNSVFEAPDVLSPFGFIEALLNVLTRPYVWASSNTQQLLSSLESPFWFLIVVAGFIALANTNRRLAIRLAFVLAIHVAVLGPIANEGLLVRQRVLMIPLLLVCLSAAMKYRTQRRQQAPTQTTMTRARSVGPPPSLTRS